MGLPADNQRVAGVVSAPEVCSYGCNAEHINVYCPTHFGHGPTEPDDITRPRRMALDTAREYFRLSREASNIDQQTAIMTALQGILRLMIYQVGGDQDGGYV